jgi:20S proteasome alpha/beta subunit
MTIAVGFVYDDGLVFCVDTKISTNIKTNESKLSWCVYGEGRNCATAFAISAMDLKFAKSAVDFCEDAVARIDFKEEGNSIGVDEVLQRARLPTSRSRRTWSG